MPLDHAVPFGLEVCLESPPDCLRSASRFGLLLNQASVDTHLCLACDRLAQRFPGRLYALFTPQHGMWCEEQANMILSPHLRYAKLDVPIHSLYSETLRPTPKMLEGLDCFVIDLQDVGTRVYTFAATALHCLQSCAEAEIPVVVLDRPNPLGGLVVEGPLVVDGFESLVGCASIPMRHGLSLGELLILLNRETGVNADLTVVPVPGWQRDDLWKDCGRVWVPPSPNMPTATTALVYPGQVLLEGTTISEGRGTTRPFEVLGAPFIDHRRLWEALGGRDWPGLSLVEMRFRPTFDKWKETACSGLGLYVTDPEQLRSFEFTTQLLLELAQQFPAESLLLPPPYEFVHDRMPLDILYGSSRLREAMERGQRDSASLVDLDAAAWWARVSSVLVY